MTGIPTEFVLRLEGGGSELLRLRSGSVASLGRDAQNRAQLAHGSIEPFHATLRCDDWGVWIRALPGASVRIGGETVADDERLVPLNGRVELGALRFDLRAAEVPAPVAALGLRRAVVKLFDRSVGFVLSATLHALALWILHRFVVEPPPPPAPLSIQSDALVVPDESFQVAAMQLPAEPELLPEPEPDIEPLTELPPPDPEPAAAGEAGRADDRLVESGARDLGIGAIRGGSGLAGVGRLSLEGQSGVGAAVLSRLQALRGSGVDLIFVIDATSSMQPFLSQARTAVDSMVSMLATLVGDLRLGVVAYRDEEDEFTTRSLPLCADRYAILNFLWTLRAEGGGDVPEAVAAGLAEAIQRGGWRKGAHRVIVVVGDAPPHARDAGRIGSMIAGFVRGDPKAIPGSIVSAIYTGPERAIAPKPEEDGAAALAQLAKLGRGDYLDLGVTEELGERLIWLVLGPHHANELRLLLSRVRDGPREEILRTKVAEGDKAWLLSKLRRPPIHPLVVEALLDQADRSVLWEARKLVADREEEREVREAALYLLRRAFPLALEFSLDVDPEFQKPLLNRLDAQILRR